MYVIYFTPPRGPGPQFEKDCKQTGDAIVEGLVLYVVVKIQVTV